MTLVLSHFLPYRLRRLFLSDNRDGRMNRGAPRRVSGEEWRRLTKESRQRRFGAGLLPPRAAAAHTFTHPARVNFDPAIHPLTSPDSRRPPRWRKPLPSNPPAESGLQEGSDDRPLRQNEARRAPFARAGASHPSHIVPAVSLDASTNSGSLSPNFFLRYVARCVWMVHNRRDTHPHVCMDNKNRTRRRRDCSTASPHAWCLSTPQQLGSLSTQP